MEIDQERVDNDPWYVFDMTLDKRKREYLKHYGMLYMYRRKKVLLLFGKRNKNNPAENGSGVVQTIYRYFSPPKEKSQNSVSEMEINNSEDVYEIIVKNDKSLPYKLHLYFGDEIMVDCMFNTINNILNEIQIYLLFKTLGFTIRFYQQMMQLLKENQAYPILHMATALGVENYIMNCDTIFLAYHLPKAIEPHLITPLQLAIKYKKINILKRLLHSRPYLFEAVDRYGNTCLHYCAISSTEIIEFILKFEDKGKLIDRFKRFNNNGFNPFVYACSHENWNNVLIMLRYGLPISCMMTRPSLETFKLDNDPILELTEAQANLIDLKSILAGGTPLHWTNDKALTDHFTKLEFDLNAKNNKGETALLNKVMNKHYSSAVRLLFAGANPNISSPGGETALTYAILSQHITMIQALIVFDADVNHVNPKTGQSLRHIVASIEKDPYTRILHLLYSMDARRCPPKQKDCKNGCRYDGNFNGIRAERWNSAKGCAGRKPYKTGWMQSVWNDVRNKLKDRDQTKFVNMLTLDGGGIRGLVSLQCLSELQRYLKHPLHEYFDWIGGTSTGSMIACALAIGKSISELKTLYFRLKDQVFIGTPPYPSETLENIIKSVVGEDMIMSDLLKKHKKYIMLTTSLVDRYPPQLYLFRSYDLAGKLPNVPGKGTAAIQNGTSESIWKAVRASSSAPLYFSSFGPFLDGGLFAGNPSLDFYLDFYRYNQHLRSINLQDECRELNVLVSIGTGEIIPEPYTMPEVANPFSLSSVSHLPTSIIYMREMIKLVYKAASATDYHINDRMEATCAMNNVPFLRLNPEVQELVELNETQEPELFNILYMTKVYMYENSETIDDLARILEDYHTKKFTKYTKSQER